MKYLIIALLFSSFAFAKEVPQINKTVNDYTGQLSQPDIESIDKEIRQYFSQSSNQLGVLVIGSLDGDDLEGFSQRVFEKWQLGDVKKDNGVLLLFVLDDRKFRIEVGQGLEGNLTDVESKRIQQQIKPYLKNKEYGRAVLEEVRLVKEKIEQNAKKELEPRSTASGSDTTLATSPISINWEFLIYLLDAVILFSGLLLTVKYSRYKKSIKSSKKMISENQEKLNKARIDFNTLDSEKKKWNSTYSKSDHKIEDTLLSRLNNINSQISDKENSIKHLDEIAKKYGVNV